MSEPQLLIIDPQRIFADPSSDWAAPKFETIVPVIDRLANHFGTRRFVTRWIPPATKNGSWNAYFNTWAFADRPATDPYFDLVDAAFTWAVNPTIDVTTFGKWCDKLVTTVGEYPHLVLTGVATDCCIITTALAAADAGATVTVISDGCAGSSADMHAKALDIMGTFAPQITITTAAEYLRPGH